jgi:hypothetical protein
MTSIEFLVHTYVLFLTARQRVFWIFQPLQLWKLALSWIAKLWLMKFYTCWPKSRIFRHLSWDIWIYFSELLLLPTFTRKETTPQLLLATKCWAHNFIALMSLLSSCFLWAHTGHFRRLRRSSSIKLFRLSSQQCGEQSSSSSYRCQVWAFPWSSSTEGWCQHHKEEAREESHKREPTPHHQLWIIF